jgi:hypothetical protein
MLVGSKEEASSCQWEADLHSEANFWHCHMHQGQTAKASPRWPLLNEFISLFWVELQLSVIQPALKVLHNGLEHHKLLNGGLPILRGLHRPPGPGQGLAKNQQNYC